MPKIVPPSGSLSAKIAIIGEAPGETEVHEGKPFVGKAGDRLDSFLAEHKILREEIYITNVIKERPPSNDVSIFIKAPNKKGEVWTSDAYDLYEHQLHQELEHCKANVFVPVGNVALYALTRRWFILRERGSILRSVQSLGDRKVIPTIHPAATFHAPLFSFSCKRDFGLIKRESLSPVIKGQNLDLVLNPSFSLALECLQRIQSGEIAAYDIEVSSKYQLSCISFACRGSSICIPFQRFSDFKNPYTPQQEADLMLEIARILEDPSILKIAHNSIFDNTFMYYRYGIVVNTCDDTMIMHGILYPELPKSLAFLTSMYTTIPFYKDEGEEGKKGYGDDMKFWEYSAKDSLVLLKFHKQLLERLDKQGNLLTYLHQLRCVRPLSFMEIRGINVQKKGIVDQGAVLGTEIIKLQQELQQLMRERLGDPTYKLPKTFAGSHHR